MSTLERVDRLSVPLEVGRFYMVPTVRAQWFATVADWPVVGPQHDDVEFFDFRIPHYHVDARFLSSGRLLGDTFRYPLSGRRPPLGGDGTRLVLPKPVWRRRKCVRQVAAFDTNGAHPDLAKMRAHFAGAQCLRNVAGFVCPHQNAPLGSVLPVDGVIVCPLHGLRINAATGIVEARK